jgi:hypothetical protein
MKAIEWSSITTDMLHGLRPLQFGLWAEIWLLVGSLHKFLSVISSKSDLLGCKFRSLFRSLMGRNLVRTLNEAQSSGGAVSVSVIFSSTWRQLNLNFLVIGFSFRCEGSKTIDKPSPSILGLLRRGGGRSNQPMCESASVNNCRSCKTSIGTFRAKNSGIGYGTETPTFSGIRNLADLDWHRWTSRNWLLCSSHHLWRAIFVIS